MGRVIEGVPGEETAVWVQDRGGGPLRLRGTLVIEDLSGVLTDISSNNGANGPLNPVTQYMLMRAANHLADRLIDDAPPTREGRESVPRILSSALGHQPFVENVLEMSQHQMLRRWPLATNWYTDVINYIMRPSRFNAGFDSVAEQVRAWTDGTLGDAVRHMGDDLVANRENHKRLRVAEALQSLWPDYAPVRNAMAAYRDQLAQLWVPIYRAILRTYGLRTADCVDVFEVSWAINAMHARETLENLGQHVMHHTEPDGSTWTLTSWSTLLLITGACVTEDDGRTLSPAELRNLAPVRPFAL